MSITNPNYPIPALSPETRTELDIKSGELLGMDFESLVEHCRRGDEMSRAQGGTRGWRPSGPRTLALRIALEVALAEQPGAA